MGDTESTSAEHTPLTMDLTSSALREIVVFIDGCAAAAGILEFAGALAKDHAARLIGVFVQPAAALSNAESFAHGKGVREVMEAHRSELEGCEAGYRATFEKVVHRHGLNSEWRSLTNFSSQVAVHAYCADLVVADRPGSAISSAQPTRLAESLVLSSGRPIILFPPNGKVVQVRRILVAWNATRESIRATADALPLLAHAEAVEVMVIDPKRCRQRVIRDHEPGADIARHLAHHGAHVEVRRLPSEGKDVGHVMLSQAAAFKADLLVMGAYGNSQVREWVFGSVTRTVLYAADIPVLMAR
jgi:nucleotide-binding universal stress UspA family protein